MQQPNVIDTTFLASETPRTPNHLCMVGVYDPSSAPNGRPSFDQILDKLRVCLTHTSSLRRRLVRVPLDLDRPYWVDDPDFDLEFHVRHLALPRPGDWRQLRTQVARLHSRPIDLARPPWEMTVIDGLDDPDHFRPGSFATVLKVHHSVIDGQSGVELLNVIHDTDPAAPQPTAAEEWNPEPVPSGRDLLGRAGKHMVVNPVRAVRSVVANVPTLAQELADAGRRAPASVGQRPRVTRTRFNRKVSAHRTWEEARCSLGDLKRVKSMVPGASINDVCLGVVAGAMRSYLAELGELPEESLVTVVPVSTRTADHSSSSGNQVSMMRVSLHSEIADPLVRLAAICAETATKKAAQNGVAMPVLLDVAQTVPGALIGAAVRGMGAFSQRAPVSANTVVTNVPGSQIPLYFLGCELVRSTGCVPLNDGIGLFHCVTSFCGTFSFMFTADRDVMPDPEPYLHHLERSIADHVAVATSPVFDEGAPKKKAATRKKAVSRKRAPSKR